MNEANQQTTTTAASGGNPSRRAFLAGAGAVATIAAAPAPAVAETGPDAELIRLCAEHVVNLAAYNRDGGGPGLDFDSDPLWLA
jgi:hypothetical protein